MNGITQFVPTGALLELAKRKRRPSKPAARPGRPSKHGLSEQERKWLELAKQPAIPVRESR